MGKLINKFNIDISYKLHINLRYLFTESQLKIPKEFWLKNVIYCIQNRVNMKCYIGQSKDFLTRFMDDSYTSHYTSYVLQSKKLLKHNQVIYNAINKYKSKNFEVYILECDVTDLNSIECYYIDLLHTYIRDEQCWGYNMTKGGDDGSQLNTVDSIKKRQETQTLIYGYPGAQMHTEMAISNRINTNRVRYGEEYATIMGACHTPESQKKQILSASETNRLKYGEEFGYVTGGCHTESARNKIIETNRLKYGEEYAYITGALHTPEARSKKDDTFMKIYGTKSGAMNQVNSIIKRNLTHIKVKLIELHDYFLNNPQLDINPNTICEAPVGPILKGAIINLSKVDKYYFDSDDIYKKLEDAYRWMGRYIRNDGSIDWNSLTNDRLNNIEFIH